MLKKDLTNYLGKCFYGEYKIFLKGHSSDRHFSKDFVNKRSDIIIGSLVHNFDQINSVFGKPKSLMANRVKANLEGILLHANVLVSYKDNILINFQLKMIVKMIMVKKLFFIVKKVLHILILI